MNNKILTNPSLKEQVYKHLKKAILSNELVVENFYSVQSISEQLGVSRSPVREAVQQLQHEDFIEIIPYRGFKIKSISKTEIQEVFEVREATESFCIKKVLSSYGTKEFYALIDELEKIIENQKQFSLFKEPKDYWKLDKTFHHSLVNYCDNKIFEQLYKSISDKISNIALITLRNKARFSTASHEHEAILKYLKLGSTEAIVKIIDHLEHTKILMLNTLKQNENLF